MTWNHFGCEVPKLIKKRTGSRNEWCFSGNLGMVFAHSNLQNGSPGFGWSLSPKVSTPGQPLFPASLDEIPPCHNLRCTRAKSHNKTQQRAWPLIHRHRWAACCRLPAVRSRSFSPRSRCFSACRVCHRSLAAAFSRSCTSPRTRAFCAAMSGGGPPALVRLRTPQTGYIWRV